MWLAHKKWKNYSNASSSFYLAHPELFGYYCAYGVFLPLFPAWLKTQSYSEESIGLLLACGYIFRFSGSILFSGLIKRVSLLVNGLRYLAVASVVTMALIGLMSHNFWLLFIGLALYSMVNAAGMPIGDSLASTWQQQIHLDYGKVRLIGSFAFVVGVMVFGYLAGMVGEQNITWMITGILIFYSIVQLLHPNPMPQDEPQSAVENSVGFLGLLKNKTTLRLFIAIALIQGSHAAYYSYSTIFWTSHGHSVSDAGLFWGISVLARNCRLFLLHPIIQKLEYYCPFLSHRHRCYSTLACFWLCRYLC